MPLLRIAGAQLLDTVHEQEPYHARVAVSHGQDGCTVAISKGRGFPQRASALSAQATASSVRNRTMKVGKRLEKSAKALATPASNEPCKELVVGFDGGYVRNRHQRPERNFEIIAGKALDSDGHATRFAFVRNGGSDAVSAIGLALQHRDSSRGSASLLNRNMFLCNF